MANKFIIHGLSEEGKAYRAALEAIQELHRPVPIYTTESGECEHGGGGGVPYPCDTIIALDGDVRG